MIKNRKLFLASWSAIVLAIVTFAASNYSSIINGLEEIFCDGNDFFSLVILCMSILSPCSRALVFLITFAISLRGIFALLYLALVISVIAFVSCTLFKRFKYTSEERNFENLKKTLESSNHRSFATSINDLMKKIAGEKNISSADKQIIEKFIQPKIDKIVNFIRGGESKDSVLLVDGEWGSGKTTAVMLGLEKGDRKNFRYIYSSSFKYTSVMNEFSKDLVASIFDTLGQFGLYIDNSATKALLDNISSGPTKLLSSFLPENENAGRVTPELVSEINEAYSCSKTNLRIIIIIDDMDRLQGEDILKTLSLLSILRKFSFVKIIIPADLKAIKSMLEKTGIYSPEMFIEKYLPESTAVEIDYGCQFIEKIIISKIVAAQTKKLAPDIYRPAWAAILFGLFSKKLHELTINTKYENYDWIRFYSKSSSNSDMSKQLKTIYSAKAAIQEAWPTGQFQNEHGYPTNKEYAFRIAGGSTFESIILTIYNQTKGTKVRDNFSEISYTFTVETWIFRFANKKWQTIGVTMREAIDFVNEIELSGLSEEPGKQFVEMFNRIFGENKLTYKATEYDNKSKKE